MATSIVKVYDRRNGKWLKNAKVVLGWNGFTNLGMSKPTYTNSDGQAIIEHSSTGKATVYINGSSVGSMQTPSSKTVEI